MSVDPANKSRFEITSQGAIDERSDIKDHGEVVFDGGSESDMAADSEVDVELPSEAGFTIFSDEVASIDTPSAGTCFVEGNGGKGGWLEGGEGGELPTFQRSIGF